MEIKSAVCSSVGRKMRINQDNFYIDGFINSKGRDYILRDFQNDGNELVAAICDGMGGEKHGEIAAMLAVESLKGCCKKYGNIYSNFVNISCCYAESANWSICKYMRENGEERMGSTVALLCVDRIKKEAIAANVGDSKVFLFRDNNLIKLSEDHNKAQTLVALGIITEDEARVHPDRSKLTQHLGIYPNECLIEPYISDTVILEDNDMLIICSDGVTELLSNNDMVKIIGQKKDVKAIAKDIIDTVNKNGGNDNSTVIVIRAA